MSNLTVKSFKSLKENKDLRDQAMAMYMHDDFTLLKFATNYILILKSSDYMYSVKIEKATQSPVGNI